MSSSSAKEAMEQVKSLMSQAIGPRAQVSDKRKFQEHLITLPSYTEYENKALFGTLVPKFFGEFEDLQDSAIDVLLDLCEDEDEKVRIIGIKGLGPTGRADPRWVRGNTGVLLQLLACQPRELKYVKDSLHMLLTVSPPEVFSVMIDDCKNSEEDTGASRKNILEYLQTDAAEQRKDILESGKNPETEQVFRDGLFELLKKASEDEGRMILGMLEPIPTVSGKNATDETKTKYLKALINSLPPKSPTNKVKELLISFKRYIEKAAPVDSRLAFLLLAKHGEMVIKQGLGENDFSLRWIFHRLKDWTGQAIDKWSETGNDGDLDEDTLASALVKALLPTFLDGCKTVTRRGNLSSMTNILEPVLYAIYSFTTLHDRRFQLVHRIDREDLLNLSKEGRVIARRIPKSSVDGGKWANIVDMAEVLADDRSKILKIVPSWESSSSRSQPSLTGPSTQNRPTPAMRPKNDVSQKIATPPIAPRGPRSIDAPAGPRNGDAGPGPSSSYNARRTPAGPPGTRYTIPPVQSSNRYRFDNEVRRDRSPDRRPLSPNRRPRSPERRPRSPDRNLRSPMRRPHSPASKPRSQERSSHDNNRESTSHRIRPMTPPLHEIETSLSFSSSHNRPPKTPGVTFTLSKADSKVIPEPSGSTLLPKTENGSSLSIRNLGRSQESTSRAQNINNPVTTSQSEKLIHTLQSENQQNSTSSSRVSLADRLGGSTSALPAKRPREVEDHQPVNSQDHKEDKDKPSLLSRLGSRDADIPPIKRVKEDMKAIPAGPRTEDPSVEKGRVSLFDRINGKSNLQVEEIHERKTVSSLPSKPLTTVDHAIPSSTRELNILNRSNTSSPQPTSQDRGISILSRSTKPPPSTVTESKNISILNKASSLKLLPSNEKDEKVEEVIVRKGRGFREKSPEHKDLIISDMNNNNNNNQNELVNRLTNGLGQSQGNGGFGFGIRGIRGRGSSNNNNNNNHSNFGSNRGGYSYNHNRN
ncbi:uncharacterized protein I206_105238 [Kwoniella pini CBS 10737]|uniref:Uncharacterized protein n=1 Tax=Kwoniella pini CBS 10737 TaxID=1296096 RepID=A0A1B9I4S4_9TREE|nr:uncharacterized protein I206_03853 [Kwoniella pini CBS 10737]OCF50528.1 hypothetical protein I206_03853 [Kwoniella pini CBS 10737]